MSSGVSWWSWLRGDSPRAGDAGSSALYQEAEARIEQNRLSGDKSLSLHALQLTTVPATIEALVWLSKLALDSNLLPVLPVAVCRLCGLTRLSLHRNLLETLPREISLLSQLEELDVYRCRLHVLPPEIGHLTKLTKLWLHNNRLFRMPPEIGRLSKLTELRLSENQLLSVPPEIGLLAPSLARLSLAGNQLSSLPYEVSFLARLTWFTCHANPWDDLHRPHLWSSPWVDGERIRKVLRIVGAINRPSPISHTSNNQSMNNAHQKNGGSELSRRASSEAPPPLLLETSSQALHSVRTTLHPPHPNNDLIEIGLEDSIRSEQEPPKANANGRFRLIHVLWAIGVFGVLSVLFLVLQSPAVAPSVGSGLNRPVWWLPFLRVDVEHPDGSLESTPQSTIDVIPQQQADHDIMIRVFNPQGSFDSKLVTSIATPPDESRCKNTKQGPLYITDDQGYFCDRSHLDKRRPGCCDPEASPRFHCDGCRMHRNSNVSCCDLFEQCVSCCMSHDNVQSLETILGLPPKITSLIYPQHRFVVCDALCRTSSSSLINGKRYLCQNHKFCYDLVLSDPPLAS